MKNSAILLTFIIILALGLRIYQLDSVPPSLSWDEAAVGYNAFTIANYGKDEYGKSFPLYFRSFGEDKQPIHIYATALSIKLLGLSEFSTRLPAAILGTLNVLLIFFLAKTLFNNSSIGLLSSLFLSLSPQNIFFSRFNHEANFALFFLMLGILLWLQAVNERKNLLPFSILVFFISMISYHAAEIITPLVVLLLTILFFKNLTKDRTTILVTVFIIGVLFIFSIFQPRLFGVSRFNQTIQGNADIEKTQLFLKTSNLFLGRINLAIIQYFWHFDPKYLFIAGDKNPRLSSQGAGEFYKIDTLFLISGVAYLIFKKTKMSIFILGWGLLAPLPSALFAEAPHAGRSAFMMGSWQIISASGLYFILELFKKKIFKRIILVVVLIILTFSLRNYLTFYLNNFGKRYAIDWQYGMKQVVEYASTQKEYDQVYMTAVRSQPYIFFLYYLKMPLSDYLNTVIYNNSQDKSSNNVSAFGRYLFGGFSPIESPATKGVLYVLSPSEYDGLKYRSDFDIKKIIYYPNGTNAFYVVSLRR